MSQLRFMGLSRVLPLALAACVAGCAGDSGSESRGGAGGKADQVGDVGGDWRKRVADDVAALEAADPELHATLMRLEARSTRAGGIRITSPAVRTPLAASVMIHRLMSETDPAMRAALVEVLPRTGGIYADAVAELVADEAAEEARVAMVGALTRVRGSAAASELADTAIAGAMEDSSAPVRAAAVRAVARRGKPAQPTSEQLLKSLADPSELVRADAAHALGVLGIDAARAPLIGATRDTSGDVRLQALRALARLGKPHLERLRTLTDDPDPRVRRLARRLFHQP